LKQHRIQLQFEGIPYNKFNPNCDFRPDESELIQVGERSRTALAAVFLLEKRQKPSGNAVAPLPVSPIVIIAYRLTWVFSVILQRQRFREFHSFHIVTAHTENTTSLCRVKRNQGKLFKIFESFFSDS
jgi:hypothetical protein